MVDVVGGNHLALFRLLFFMTKFIKVQDWVYWQHCTVYMHCRLLITIHLAISNSHNYIHIHIHIPGVPKKIIHCLI